MANHSIFVQYIEEFVVQDKRLGRHIRRDSRSATYPYLQSGNPLSSNLLSRRIAILNQGNVGSCTGNAKTGELGTDPLWSTLLPQAQVALDENFALSLYSQAETIDGDGPYPPNDNGSCGLSVSQAAKNDGLIGGYVHCASLTDILDALSSGRAVILGTNWYDSMDHPDSGGLVTVSAGAAVRGGHEYLCRGLDVTGQLVLCDNSWGQDWGDKGSFSYSWTTLDRLLSEQGDGVVSSPVSTAPPAVSA